MVLKFLNREIDRYHPCLIVMQFCDNDFTDNINERLYVITKDNRISENSNISVPGKRKIQDIIESIPMLSYSYLLGLFKQVRIPKFGKCKNFSADRSNCTILDGDRLTYAILEEVLKICKKKNISVIALNINLKGERLDKIKQAWRKYGVLSIGIPNKEDSPDLYYRIDGHWNALGHAFVTKKILSLFENEKYARVIKAYSRDSSER